MLLWVGILGIATAGFPRIQSEDGPGLKGQGGPPIHVQQRMWASGRCASVPHMAGHHPVVPTELLRGAPQSTSKCALAAALRIPNTSTPELP